MRDICPSRDDAQPHLVENGECVMCGKRIAPLASALREKFLSLACALSPENLTCDGELSNAQVSQRLNDLRSQWRNLELEAGRKVGEGEVWADSQ